MQANLTDWIISQLSSLLHFQVTNDMAKCILLIESNRDLEEYMSTLLDFSNPAHQKFVKELIRRKPIANAHAYKKTQLDDYVGPTEKKEKKKVKGKGEVKKAEDGGKKKTKYVNLYSSDDVVLLKGRHVCNCQASKHKLINNCLKCGRIVCQQEGSGPCLYCSTPVYSREELEAKPELTKPELTKPSQALSSALQLKERLLQYDKASDVRTRVIDDESDYFSTNSVWLSKEMKEKLEEKQKQLDELKHSRRRDLILDFTGRCLIDDEFKRLNLESSILEEVAEMMDKSASELYLNDHEENTDENIKLFFEDSGGKRERGGKWHNNMGKVQDRQVMEMSDEGVCLSLHQPWASLLILGIKTAEGRSWYTSHRGRLWIAATSKTPTDEEVQEACAFYSALRNEEVKLPRKLGTGCLLGCVNLVDCLAQEEYRLAYPDGEVEDPFVFICEQPIKSPVLFPIKGKHKIYKLETKIHEAATKCLEKLGKV